MDQFCYERRFSFWFPNAATWLGCHTCTYRRYFLHFSSRTCEFVFLVMYEFVLLVMYELLPLIHMSAPCVQACSSSLTHWVCACALLILSFIYHNAERSAWYQLLGCRWFFASSTLQLFALQTCIHNSMLVNYMILDELALCQICDLFSSWHSFFYWLLLLNPNWIPGCIKKHRHVCSTSYYTLPYGPFNHQRDLCEHKLHSWASHLCVNHRGQHTSVWGRSSLYHGISPVEILSKGTCD